MLVKYRVVRINTKPARFAVERPDGKRFVRWYQTSNGSVLKDATFSTARAAHEYARDQTRHES